MRLARRGMAGRMLVALLACLLLAAVGRIAQAHAATYTVGITSDPVGAACTPSSGKCSLRELISYENGLTTTPNPPTRSGVPAGPTTYEWPAERSTQSINITGAGAQSADIYQETTSPTSRVFSIQPNAKKG